MLMTGFSPLTKKKKQGSLHLLLSKSSAAIEILP